MMSNLILRPSTFQTTVLKSVREGIEGKNQWLPVPIKAVRRYFGIGKQIYYLIGGDPGSGKSAFAHLIFILSAFKTWRLARDKGETDIDLKIFLRSMERPERFIVGKWVCLLLMLKYKILMDVNTLYTFGARRSAISEEIYQCIAECQEFVDDLFNSLTIISGAENPTGIYEHMRTVARDNGTIHEKEIAGNKKKVMTGYTPHNEHAVILYILDHIGKLTLEREFNRKANTDKMGEYLTTARDQWHFSPVVVSQFNRNLSDTGRRNSNSLFTPESSDFKDSGSMYEDCDVAISLFSPQRYHVSDYEGYQVQRFADKKGHNRLRIGTILKNSYGPDNINFAMQFIGENGYYRGLAHPEKFTKDDYLRINALDGLVKRRIEQHFDED